MSKVVSIVSTDPIADMLSRIRNAIAINSQEVSLPHSKVKETVAKILTDNGFLQGVKVQDEDGRKTLTISINGEGESAKITEIHRLSRPGRRMYVKSPAIPTVRHGRGLVVISTSQGIMAGKDAASKKLGGELICEVY
jgi:small subunit ribosomal protein S8